MHADGILERDRAEKGWTGTGVPCGVSPGLRNNRPKRYRDITLRVGVSREEKFCIGDHLRCIVFTVLNSNL